MKSFKDFNIRPEFTAFTGDKINIDKVLNVEIAIQDYKVEDSTKIAGTKRLTLQIELKGERRVIFTGAKILLQTIQKVPKENFPFTTTIVKRDQHLEFT